MKQKPPKPGYDTARMQDDMALRGWNIAQLAVAAKLTPATPARFLNGKFQTAKVAQKLAHALGYSVKRYLISAKKMAVQA